MSTPNFDRPGLITTVIDALRSLNRQAVLFSDAVAERLGMASSDVECLEVLMASGPATAGQLAEATGLSTGAVTRMVDRLEQAGYVRRVADAADRRRVIVEVVPDRTAAIAPLFESIGQVTSSALERYSDEQLRLILEFVEQTLEVSRTETARVRETDLGSSLGGQVFSAPLGSLNAGRLVLMSGFTDLVLGPDAQADRLFRARFAGAPPRVRVRGGVVAIHALRSVRQWLNQTGELSFTASIPFNVDLSRGLGKIKVDVNPRTEFRSRGPKGEEDQARGEVLLNTTIPWDIDVQGGLSRLSADLRSNLVASLTITGGASGATVELPRPITWTPVRLVGGASEVTLRRPAGVPVRLRVRGGVSNLDLDGQHLSSVGGGDVRMDAGAAAGANAGYEVEIVGGASRLAIEVSSNEAAAPSAPTTPA
jgi:DNA-binding MarR family transcriptional regulator